MNRLRKIFKNMKYRHKLTIFLVVTSLVPMTVLAWYSHSRLSTMVRSSELEDMQSIMEQTRESIDSQTAVYASLLNYLTYSPDIEEIIKEKNIDNYTAYEKYTEIADPLLSVPKSYHDAINRIQLLADSIQVEHEYTLVPLDKMKEEWWSEGLKNDVRIQWKVDQDRKEVAAVRMIYNDQKLDAVLCISLDYNKIFQPLTNILTQENGGIVADKNGTVLYNKTGLTNLEFDKSEKMDSMIQKISQSCAYTKTKSEENDWVFSAEAVRGTHSKNITTTKTMDSTFFILISPIWIYRYIFFWKSTCQFTHISPLPPASGRGFRFCDQQYYLRISSIIIRASWTLTVLSPVTSARRNFSMVTSSEKAEYMALYIL